MAEQGKPREGNPPRRKRAALVNPFAAQHKKLGTGIYSIRHKSRKRSLSPPARAPGKRKQNKKRKKKNRPSKNARKEQQPNEDKPPPALQTPPPPPPPPLPSPPPPPPLPSPEEDDEKIPECDDDNESRSEFPPIDDPSPQLPCKPLPEGLCPMASKCLTEIRQNPVETYKEIEDVNEKCERSLFEQNISLMALTLTIRENWVADINKKEKSKYFQYLLSRSSVALWPKKPPTALKWFRACNNLPLLHEDSENIFNYCSTKSFCLPQMITFILDEQNGGIASWGVTRKIFLSKLKQNFDQSNSSAFYMDNSTGHVQKTMDQEEPKPTESGIRIDPDDPAYKMAPPQPTEKFRIAGLGKRTFKGHQDKLKAIKKCVNIYEWKPADAGPTDTRIYMPAQNPGFEDKFWREGPPPDNVDVADCQMHIMIHNYQYHFNSHFQDVLYQNNLKVVNYFCAKHAGIHDHSGFGWWAILSDNTIYHACVTCQHITLGNFSE
jgi:hypothetical protein